MMKKKFLPAALILAVLLTACGGGQTAPSGSPAPSDEPPVTSPEATPTPAAELPADFSFAAGDDLVYVNQDMADVLAALGDPQSYFEAASCAFEGLDKTYTYPGFSITTRPDGDKDYVNSILLTDDSVTTREGVYIGSATEDIAAAYGEDPNATDTRWSYVAGDTLLSFILQDGTVISIEYLPA